MNWPPKEDLLGTGISLTSIAETVRLFRYRSPSRAVTVNVCNVHSVMSARRDPRLAAALAAAEINTPDGMPLVWMLRERGFMDQTRVKGTELALATFEASAATGWRHFFYGATPATLERLRGELERKFPGLQIRGQHAPPFRELTEAESAQVVNAITAARPDIVWVGLGMPKQEKWMHQVATRLPGMVLVGIGAAFDFMAGTRPEAPSWMQRAGLEWLFRLGTEPRRLWRRYAWNNPAFVALWLR